MAEKNTKKASYGKKFVSALIVTAFTVFTLLFFSPLEIFLGNAIEFKFSMDIAAIILFFVALLISISVSALVSLLPIKALRPYNIIVFGIGFCAYFQSLFLNGNMGSLTGEEDHYSLPLIIVNLLIWVAIFVALIVIFIVLKKRKKAKTFFSAVRFVALALIVMQLSGVTVAYFKTDKSIDRIKDTYITTDSKLELSQNENVVYFIIDTCDGTLVEQALKDYPDLFSGFNGFTYFPNMSTTHSRTFPSLTYLLTGQKCYFDKPYTEYVNEAFENSSFIDDIDALGTDIRLYTELSYIGESVLDELDNVVKYDSASIGFMNVFGFIKQSVKVSGYRVAPYAIKDVFEYTADIINTGSLAPIDNRAKLFDDIVFNNEIITNGVTNNKNYSKTFRLYHMFGTHPGAVMNENCEYENGVSSSDSVRGCLRLIENYITEMKENGNFDNTTIIITADHGHSLASDDLSLVAAPSCILLVKPAGNEDSEKIKTSLAPVCHEDLFATVIDALGGDSEKYGRTVWEIGENEDRERKYYHTALVSDIDGEIALREYLIKGDARNLESYTPTGNNWDVNYSKRAVSKKRLKDFVK